MDRALLGAVGLMVCGMSLIPLGDTAGKLLTGAHGLSPFLVAFARFAVGAALVLLLLGGRVEWRLWRDGRVWLRAALIAAGIASILRALETAPLASVFGAFFVGPLVSFALSVLLLRERATALQVGCLLLGFAGVLVIVRPGLAPAPGLGWALLAGVFYGGFLAASRWLGGIAPPRQLMLTQTAMGALLLLPTGIATLPSLPPVDGAVAGLLLLSGLASASGNLLLVLAYRRAPATVLAPFVYAQLGSAALLGWLVFGEVPDRITAAGMALVVVAGLGTLLAARRAPVVRPGPGPGGGA